MRLVASLAVLVACSAPPASTLPAAAAPVLTWSTKLEGDRVRIDYTVDNGTSERIVLLDHLRDTNGRTDFAVVRASDRPTIVAFTLGYVPPDPSSKVDLRPMARVLEPHAKTSGTAYAKWPLRAQHNTSPTSHELPPGLDGVQLEIGYIDGANRLETITADGESFSVPDTAAMRSQKLLRSQIRELPLPLVPAPLESPIEIMWAPMREGTRLRLDYTVRNRGDKPLVICDRMRNGDGPTDRAVVRPSGTDGVVAFTVAFVPPVQAIVEHQPRPIARLLAPNEIATGVAYVNLPIQPYHPIYEPEYTLPPRFDYAVFEVGFVEDTVVENETSWRGRQTYEVPRWSALRVEKFARGDVQHLP